MLLELFPLKQFLCVFPFLFNEKTKTLQCKFRHQMYEQKENKR